MSKYIPSSLTCALILFSVSTEAQLLTSIGDVFDTKTDQLIYREFHTFDKSPSRENMRTSYKDLDNKEIGTRTVNFSVTGYASDYVFKQPELGIDKRVVRSTGKITYTELDGRQKTIKEFSPKNMNTAVVNAGMFNAIERAWPELNNGQSVEINLVVPDRARTFKMVVQKVAIDESNLAKHLDTQDHIVFKMRIANRFLRLLVAPVELGYNIKTKRLTYYQGPSNIRKPDNKEYKEIRVIYTNQ